MDNNSGEDEKKPPANGNEDELRDMEPEVSPPQVDQGEGENLVAGSLESEQDVTSEALVDASGGESGSSSAVGSGSVEGSTCCCLLEEPSATPASTIPDESVQSPQPSTSTVDEQSMLRAPKKRYRNNRALDLQMNQSVRRRLFTGPEFRQQEPETPTTEQSSEVKMVQGGNGGENVPAAPKKRKRDDDESDEPRKRLRTLAQMSGVRRRLFSTCAAEASSSSSSDDSQKKTQEKETHEQKAEDEGIQQEQKAEDESQRPDEREHREISAAVASIVQGFVEEIITEEQVDVGQEFSPESVEVANLMEELVETVVLQDSVVSGSGETLDDKK